MTGQTEFTPILAFDDLRDLIRAEITPPATPMSPRELKAIRERANSFCAEQFNPWLDRLAPASEDVGSLDMKIRNALEFAYDVSYSKASPWWSTAFATWAVGNTELEEAIHNARKNPAAFRYYDFIAKTCRSFGEAMLNGEGHTVISPFYKEEISQTVRYRTKHADGSWHDVEKTDLVASMRDPNGPHVVMISNHAFLETQKVDIEMLHDAYVKLFNESKRKPPTSEQQVADYKSSPAQNMLSTWDKEGLSAKDAVMVMATYTNKNRFLNLADLFERLDEQQVHAADPRQDTFSKLAPIARDMVENIMQSIVSDADSGRIKFQRDAQGRPLFFDLTEGAITLRADALDILRRQIYRGFSKGGNDFRCAARLLARTLDAKDTTGNPLVTMPHGHSIRDLMSSLSVIVFGCNELKMEEYYTNLGVRVPWKTNNQDTIAIASAQYTMVDPIFRIPGDSTHNGHTPAHLVDAILADSYTRDLMHMANASAHGNAAIANVHLVAQGDSPNKFDAITLGIELSPGTTDAMFDSIKAGLLDSCKKHGLPDLEITRRPDNQSALRYQLHGKDGAELITVKIITALKAALMALDKDGSLPVTVSHILQMEQLNAIKGALVLKTDLSISDPTGMGGWQQFVAGQGSKHPRVAAAQGQAQLQ